MLNTFKIVDTLSPQKVSQIKEHILTNLSPLATPDVSNYAKGRLRLWLNQEPTLVKDYTIKPAIQDDRLWEYICTIYHNVYAVNPSFALVAVEDTNIDLHRDATYAGWKALSINLGRCTWHYQECYPDFRWSKQSPTPTTIEAQLYGGEVISFNPKNPHGVSNASEDRMSINIWCRKYSS